MKNIFKIFVFCLLLFIIPSNIDAKEVSKELYLTCNYNKKKENINLGGYKNKLDNSKVSYAIGGKGELDIYNQYDHNAKIEKLGTKSTADPGGEELQNYSSGGKLKDNISSSGCPKYLVVWKGIGLDVRGYYKLDTLTNAIINKTHSGTAYILEYSSQKKGPAYDDYDSGTECIYDSDTGYRSRLGDIRFKKSGSNGVAKYYPSIFQEGTGMNDSVIGSYFYKNGQFTCLDKVYIQQHTVGGSGQASHQTFRINLEYSSTDGSLSDSAQEEQDKETDGNVGPGGLLPDDQKVEEVSNICNILTPDMLELLKDIIGYVQIGTVFLALILGILDFVGAIGSDKDNAFKDAGKKFLKRLVAVALVFLVPALLGIILNFVSVANDCHLEIFG